MRVLLSGASGFIGRQLSLQLAQSQDFELLALPGRAGLDLTDPACLPYLPPAQQIIHLAGIAGLEAFDADPRASWQANLLIMLHLLEHARISHCQRLVLASSYLYGQPQYLPVDELHPLAPHHAYQRSKYVCEQMAEQYAQDYGFELVILRIFNVYGPGQDKSMLIPSMLAQLEAPRLTLRDPDPRRDFVHVADVARAFVLALGAELPAQINYFNLGSGQSLSVAELLQTLFEQLPPGQNRPEVCWTHQRRQAEVSDVVADISKARAQLGWTPTLKLEAGLRELLCVS